MSKPSRILIVEDHDDTRQMLKVALELKHFSVLEASDGGEAYDLAIAELPDLILMDLTLPTVDGVAATEMIRAHQAISGIPIIFLSGRADASRKHDALAAGCNDYLTKPVDIDEMLSVMGRWLNNGSSHAAGK